MNPNKILQQTSHRAWARPDGPWVMTQSWMDLLFAHWPVPADLLRPLIPEGLALQTWEGQAWLGVVPFRMENVTPRFVPPLPWLSAFPELNLRTYVTAGGKQGVWFFSLDAANPVAVRVARKGFNLPYFDARMDIRKQDDWYRYTSHRTHKEAFPADLKAMYRPTGRVYTSKPGTLEHWLTERYCLYAADPQGKIWRGEIHHAPWPLQKAEARFDLNTMAGFLGQRLDQPPATLHFSRRIDVVIWPIQPLA